MTLVLYIERGLVIQVEISIDLDGYLRVYDVKKVRWNTVRYSKI